MSRNSRATGVDRLFGSEPNRIWSVVQIFSLLTAMAVINELINSNLTGWREQVYPGTFEVMERFLVYASDLPNDWISTVRHLSIGVLGAIPGFLFGMYLALHRRFTPSVLLLIAGSLSYSKLIIGVNFFLLTQNKELTVYMFGWWTSGLYGCAVGYFTARKILAGRHLIINQAALDIALIHFSTRRKFYLYFLLPHMLPELLLILSLSSAAISGSFLFTESLVQVAGLGTKGLWAAEVIDLATLQVVGIALMLNNMGFWLLFNTLFQRYEFFGNLVARMIDYSLGRR